jgi:hypothetical protein
MSKRTFLFGTIFVALALARFGALPANFSVTHSSGVESSRQINGASAPAFLASARSGNLPVSFVHFAGSRLGHRHTSFGSSDPACARARAVAIAATTAALEAVPDIAAAKSARDSFCTSAIPPPSV